MKDKFQKELGTKKYFVMKYGYVIILITMALIIYSFFVIKIEDKSLVMLIKEYYLR